MADILNTYRIEHTAAAGSAVLDGEASKNVHRLVSIHL